LIAVTGATGAQGGSVVRFLLENGGFRVRALTRNVNSEVALVLKSKGVDIVRADFDDFESLVQAFKGVGGAFLLTNFWDPTVMSEEREFATGKALVDAAKEAGVGHVVYSTIEASANPKAAHFDSKYRVNEYLIASGLKRTSLYTAFYFENFINQDVFKLRKGVVDGTKLEVVADWPVLWTDGPIPGYAVADTGAYVLAAFKEPEKWIGRDIKVFAEIFTPRQYVDALKEFAPRGVEIAFKEKSFEEFDQVKNGAGLAKELHANMMAFYSTEGTLGRSQEEIAMTERLYPERLRLKEFVEKNIGELLPQ